MATEKIISSRSDLLSLLSEACELEHGLACSYLYAAFSLKKDLHEGGLTWPQLQKIRKWAAQIYFVASQEMLHLAQAWNLLTAIGGTPYYLRPNFPQGTKYYPLHLALTLTPFNHRTLQRFIFYESPQQVTPERVFSHELNVAPAAGASGFEFHTIGELYSMIASGFETIPEPQLFIGRRENQVGPTLIDFPDIVEVTDRASAKQAIAAITHQGEGTQTDRDDCHFGIFHKILDEFLIEEKASHQLGEVFTPARNVMKNPAAQNRGDYGAPESKIIEDEFTRKVAQLFDSVYNLMLRMLSYVFNHPTGSPAIQRQFAKTAIAMMPTVVLPLGEALTLLPAGPGFGEQTAGPGFGMSRHVPLSADANVALILVQERITELIEELKKLASEKKAPIQLTIALNRFVDLSQSFNQASVDDSAAISTHP